MENQSNNPKVAIFNYNKDCTIITGSDNVVATPGTPINVFQGTGRKKAEKPKQPAQEREQMKLQVLAEITGKFNFSDDMLGIDANGNRYTNERIGILFGKCLGLRGAHPSKELLDIIDKIWEILIDERNKTPREGGELYFRQTVLNIIGYFHQQGVIEGMPQKIAMSVFPSTNKKEIDKIKKNVERGISSTSFPEGTEKVLDFYIDKLHNGEF